MFDKKQLRSKVYCKFASDCLFKFILRSSCENTQTIEVDPASWLGALSLADESNRDDKRLARKDMEICLLSLFCVVGFRFLRWNSHGKCLVDHVDFSIK